MVLTANIIEIEGLAMNGLLREAKLVPCEKPTGWQRIVVIDGEGRELSTACIEPDAARRNFMVIQLYLRQWGHLIYEGEEVEGRPEEE